MSQSEQIVEPIVFRLDLTLEANLRNEITINYQGKETVIKDQERLSIQMQVPFTDVEERIELIKFTGFRPDPSPQILIRKLLINGYEVHDYRNLFSFDMADNAFVENKVIPETDVISFNGALNLETKKNRDRFTWFPITYSRNRTDMVYRNTILNCQSQYGCFAGLDCQHDPLWKRYELRGEEYDFIALGCSVTAGTGIEKHRSWPALLGDTTLNLGVPGGGCDTMLNNIKCLIDKKIRFKKAILLFPSEGRRLFRLKRHGYSFNLPMLAPIETNQPMDVGKFNIFFDKHELDDYSKQKSKELIINYDPKRDHRIIKRISKLLKDNGIEFYMSSWSKDTYEFLTDSIAETNLLPMFNEEGDDSRGIDGSHPAENIHEKWVKSIEKQIGLGK